MRAIPSTLMRGGTSKGLYFHAKDLPPSAPARDRALLAAMGSPDPRQIDGVGGAHPLTSKVAIIGSPIDRIAGLELTCIDNGMPVVLMRAADLGKRGDESPEALEGDEALKARIEEIRLAMGPRMNLGNVGKKTVPKMCLVSPARHGGTIHTRTFIPHRVHEAIGVLGAVSVATACLTPGSVAAQVAGLTPRSA